MIRPAWSVCIYFGLRILCALVLLKAAALWLPLDGFGQFAQLGIFAALINFISVGALQNGLVRAVAAARNGREIGEIHAAALSLWLAMSLALLCLLLPAVPLIATILLGAGGSARAVASILAICTLVAPGQIWCGLLTGQHRVTASLSAQGAGLLAGTASAAWAIAHGNAALAAALMSAGGLATAVIACSLARPFALPGALRRPDGAVARNLLRYASATALAAAASSSILFGLRAYYRNAAGVEALGHWLAANRISDMSTQFIGLGMAQIILPRLVGAPGPDVRRAILVRAGMAGTVVTLAALLLFLAAARPLTLIFLSTAYLAAIPAISLYLAGDCLRVWVSLAQHANLAQQRLGHYAFIELASAGLMATIMFVLMAVGDTRAPQIAYVATQLCVAAVAWLLLSRKAGAGRSAPSVRAETA